MSTGKKKQRPTDLPITLRHNGIQVTKRVALGDYPDFLLMPVFESLPGIARAAEIGPLKRIGWRLSRNNEHFIKALHSLNADPNSAVIVHFDTQAFVRMLAKIAHGIAWAELGGDGFQPGLIGIIEGSELDNAGYLIGVDPNDLSHTIQNSHVYSCFAVATNDPDTLFVHVRIRLWAALGAPTYSLIAGVIKRGVHSDW